MGGGRVHGREGVGANSFQGSGRFSSLQGRGGVVGFVTSDGLLRKVHYVVDDESGKTRSGKF